VYFTSGWYYTATKTSGKIFMVTVLILSFIWVAVYSGAIISVLAVSSVPVTSVRSLNDYGFGFMFNPIFSSFFDTNVIKIESFNEH